MANRNYSRRNSGGKAKAILAGVLILALCLGVAYSITAGVKGEYNPVKWFQKQDTPTEEVPGGTAIEVNEGIDNGVAVRSFALYSSVADTQESDLLVEELTGDYIYRKIERVAVQGITATVETDFATDKRLNWSLSWSDNTVTDDISQYLTVAKATTESGEANSLRCLKAFAHTAKLTVSGNSEPEVYSTATIDFLALPKIAGMENLDGDNWGELYPDQDGLVKVFSQSIATGQDIYINNYYTGSKKPTMEPEWANLENSAYKMYDLNGNYIGLLTWARDDLPNDKFQYNQLLGKLCGIDKPYSNMTSSEKVTLYNFLKEKHDAGAPVGKVVLEYTMNNGAVHYYHEWQFNVRPDDFKTPITKVNLSEINYLF